MKYWSRPVRDWRGAFARLGLVDEFQLFIAGKFLGSSAARCSIFRWRR